MSGIEKMGDEGEERFMKYLETIPGFIEAERSKLVNKFHPYIDVAANFVKGLEAYQVKTKSSYDERIGKMRCHRTDRVFEQRKDHGFERFRYENFLLGKQELAQQNVPLFLIFIENSTGMILLCNPEKCDIRYGNGAGGAEFVYFNRDLMVVLCRPLP